MLFFVLFFFQAEDGIRDLVRSRGLGDVYKRQLLKGRGLSSQALILEQLFSFLKAQGYRGIESAKTCLLYTSDAADERSSVDLGGRRIIKKKNKIIQTNR